MSQADLFAFLPELVLLAGAALLFFLSCGDGHEEAARRVSLGTAIALIAAALLTWGQDLTILSGAYRIDAFSQLLKLVFGVGYLLVILAGGSLPDIRIQVKPEYFLLVAFSLTGLVMLVSSIEIITLVIALELSSFPLFLLVPLRCEHPGHRSQMEAAAKYIMFGVAATGLMFYGLSYLYGMTGTLHLPDLLPRLAPLLNTPMAIAALALTFCGLFFKLAVFPFHYWSPDVYQGSSTETAALIASLPKVGAVAILVRFASLVPAGHQTMALMLAVVCVISMFYGNLIALVQQDVKRLLGFSAIAHAGYAMIGFVALNPAGYAAALYYIISYVAMVIACFVVLRQLVPDGTDVTLSDLAGLHRRSPLLAATIAVGVFGLAGLPPMAGFMGKLMLLKAALAEGHLTLVILAVINTAIAIYYYLQIVREVYFKEAEGKPALAVPLQIRFLCVVLMAIAILLGLFPGLLLDPITTALSAAP